MKNRILFFSLLLPFFCGISCASWQEGWTEEYQKEFKESCLSGDGSLHPDPAAYCDCALQKTIKQYPTIAAFMEQGDTAAYHKALKQCP